MAKKTFLANASLKKGERWYIDFQLNHPNNTITRHRKDFGLNAVEDLEVREQVASVLCNSLPSIFNLLGSVKTFEPDATGETIRQAIMAILEVKSVGPRKKTGQCYASAANIFLKFCEDNKIDNLPVADFSRKWCIRFFDTLRSKKLLGITLKNYQIRMRAIWNAMIAREMAEENPWRSVSIETQVEPKKRRAFTTAEKKVVARFIEEHDYWLFRALLLQYYCYIRPAEISRLKFRDFNLVDGTVTVERNVAKKWKKRIVTIPTVVLRYFRDGKFDQYPINYYLLGEDWRPGDTPEKEHRMYQRHQRILQSLLKLKMLDDITGLSWYSWKDTGISINAHLASVLSTRDQAGHADIGMTMIYYQPAPINEEYRKLPDTLLGK